MGQEAAVGRRGPTDPTMTVVPAAQSRADDRPSVNAFEEDHDRHAARTCPRALADARPGTPGTGTLARPRAPHPDRARPITVAWAEPGATGTGPRTDTTGSWSGARPACARTRTSGTVGLTDHGLIEHLELTRREARVVGDPRPGWYMTSASF